MLYPQSCSLLCCSLLESLSSSFYLHGYVIWTYASPSRPILSFSEPFPFHVTLSVMGGPKLLTVFKRFYSVTALSTLFCVFFNRPLHSGLLFWQLLSAGLVFSWNLFQDLTPE